MSRSLVIRNRQRTRQIDHGSVRRILRHLLQSHFKRTHYEIGVHLLDAKQMAHLNETYLAHGGSTDVITFPYEAEPLIADIFVCVDEAVAQARRYKTTWQAELVRYLIHGLLHLHGYDDQKAGPRHRMKRAENRLLTELSARFKFSELQRQAHD